MSFDLPRRYGKALYLKLRRVRMRHATPIHTRTVWERELPEEVPFWDEFLATGGLEWKADFERLVAPDSPVVDPLITRALDRSPLDRIAILDVGAGPLTVVGTTYPRKQLSITPIDPLAAEYNALLAKHGITPPVRTIACDAERLLDRFEPESFDLAYARNSLDHSYDPVTAIRNMLRVTKNNGTVLLRHRAHEGENMRYYSVHQWNFDVDRGAFVIWSHGVEHNVTTMLAPEAFVSCERDGVWVTCAIHKHAGRS